MGREEKRRGGADVCVSMSGRKVFDNLGGVCVCVCVCVCERGKCLTTLVCMCACVCDERGKGRERGRCLTTCDVCVGACVYECVRREEGI